MNPTGKAFDVGALKGFRNMTVMSSIFSILLLSLHTSKISFKHNNLVKNLQYTRMLIRNATRLLLISRLIQKIETTIFQYSAN